METSFQGLSVASVGNQTSWSTLQQVLSADINYKRTSDALVVLSAVAFVLLNLLPRLWNNGGAAREKPQFPPCPPRWPILGNFPQVWREGAALHTTLRLLGKKLGPIYTLWLGRSVCNPALVFVERINWLLCVCVSLLREPCVSFRPACGKQVFHSYGKFFSSAIKLPVDPNSSGNKQRASFNILVLFRQEVCLLFLWKRMCKTKI